MGKKKFPGCVLCEDSRRNLKHEHLDGGILALLPPSENADEEDYRLVFFWAEGDEAKHVALTVGDWQDAKYYYRMALGAGTAAKVREIVIQLARPSTGYGKPPPRPDACWRCGNRALEAIRDAFGGYWSCLTCGATSDPLTVPPGVLAEVERRKKEK